ncbi:MAG: magnesium transporter CorA family protein [Chitinivibrionia bacterium]|nr:magnesium transporter CorA family protein [Chitinivibrionia bacterium]
MLQKYDLINSALVSTPRSDSAIHIYSNPTAEERKHLIASLNLDQHSLSSALDPDEISRVEFKPDLTFMVWKRPENYTFTGEVRFNVSSIGLVLTTDRLVIILAEDTSLFNEQYAHRMENQLDIVLNVLSQTTRHFLEHLKVIKQISREIQQKINTALENEYLIQMFSLGESLTYYLNAISSNAAVIAKLRGNIDRMKLSAQQTEFLDDILIENSQCYKQAEIYSNVLSGLMDARGTLVNNNMNVILKNLTIINTIFLPLNLIASIGGMSEFSFMTKGVDWRVSYAIFGIAMIALGCFTAMIISRFGGWQKKRKLA